jgi:hypothetical protein
LKVWGLYMLNILIFSDYMPQVSWYWHYPSDVKKPCIHSNPAHVSDLQNTGGLWHFFALFRKLVTTVLLLTDHDAFFWEY